MNMQKLMLGVFRRLPAAAIRRMAGPPQQVDGFTLDPYIQLLTRQEGPDLSQLPVAEARTIASEMMRTLNAPRRRGVVVSDERLPGPAGPMAVRHYFANGAARPSPLILFFHQGGMVLLDLDSCDTFCTILAQTCRAHVISLDYRLAPEHVFPAALEDAEALWDYVIREAETLGVDVARIGVCGDSAGGLMTASLCQQLRDKGAKVQPKAQLMVYPWVSSKPETSGSAVSCADAFPLNQTVMQWFMGQVFPKADMLEHPLANPLHNELRGLPPAIVATAGFDPLRDQGKAYAEALKKAGVDARYHCFGDLSHSFLAFGQVSRKATAASEQLAREFATLLEA